MFFVENLKYKLFCIWIINDSLLIIIYIVSFVLWYLFVNINKGNVISK